MLLLLIIRLLNIIKFRNYYSLLTSLLLIWPALYVYTISFYFLIHLISAGVRVLTLGLLFVYFLILFFFFLLSSSFSSLLSSLLFTLFSSKSLNYKLTQSLNT